MSDVLEALIHTGRVERREGGLFRLASDTQRVSNLVEEKRLRQHDFFGKEFISCKDLEAFRKIERKTGRPKSETERVDESHPLTKGATHEGKRPRATASSKRH